MTTQNPSPTLIEAAELAAAEQLGLPGTKTTVRYCVNGVSQFESIFPDQTKTDYFTAGGYTWHAYCDGAKSLAAAAVGFATIAYTSLV